MVVVLATQTVDVKCDSGTLGETLENVGNHLGAELAKPLALQAELDDAVRSVGEIDDGAGEGLVEGSVSVSVASETCGSSEGLGEGVAQGDADIFGGVVIIDCTTLVGSSHIALSSWETYCGDHPCS